MLFVALQCNKCCHFLLPKHSAQRWLWDKCSTSITRHFDVLTGKMFWDGEWHSVFSTDKHYLSGFPGVITFSFTLHNSPLKRELYRWFVYMHFKASIIRQQIVYFKHHVYTLMPLKLAKIKVCLLVKDLDYAILTWFIQGWKRLRVLGRLASRWDYTTCCVYLHSVGLLLTLCLCPA